MPTLSTSPLTLLDAVNLLLANARLGKADSLQAKDTNEDLRDALTELEDASRIIQLQGWRFNTVSALVIDPETDGTIIIPPNFHKVRMAGPSRSRDLTLRGRDGTMLLYDIRGNTFVIGEAVTLDAIRVDAFEDLPPALRQFAAYRAVFEFCARKTPNGTPLRLKQSDLEAAEAAWIETDAWEDDRALPDTSPHFNAFRRR